jgi:hypothetical protein
LYHYVKETAKRCPMCGQLTGVFAGGGGEGGGGSGHAHADDGEPTELERQRRGASKGRLRGLGKLWSSATR